MVCDGLLHRILQRAISNALQMVDVAWIGRYRNIEKIKGNLSKLWYNINNCQVWLLNYAFNLPRAD